VNEVNAEAMAWKNKINAWTKTIGDSMVRTERAGFNFNRPWQVLFITNTQVAPTSILAAEKVSIVAADGVVLDSSPLNDFHFKGKKGSVKGKLLTEKESKKTPVPNVMVSLLNLKTGREEPDSALTDVYGDFEISVQDESAEYSIVVKSHSANVDNIILATQSGQEVAKLKKTSRGFEYKLIPNDIVLLTERENEDITMLFHKFGGSKETNLKVSENILYALGQYKIEDQASKVILDKVVRILKDHPKVTLQVISHTDAQGDDAFNMALSEKRSASVINYFIQKGIDKNRLTSVGKGETEIRNRCMNGIDCSDMEHEYNRRTEFKFTKG
jgi:outer membrane protein OmpA-like peptidoglycan-associated protein